MNFKLSMTMKVVILCTILTQSTSKYEGVSWNEEKKRWQIEFDFHGKIRKYYFDNENDAIKTRNRVYKKMRSLSPQDPENCEIPNQKAKEKTSQYKGVCWKKANKKWMVRFDLKGQLRKYGGCFNNELDAAKRVNELCKELRITEKNPGIGMPNQQWKAKEKTSQYKGVFLHKQTGKWDVGVRRNGNGNYGGSFIDELDAAKKVNQLCEELGIPERNPGIGTMPLRPCQAKEKTSKYKGVSWSNKQKKWYVRLYAKGRNPKYGGSFSNELDAAKKVNQLCAEFQIAEKNLGIGKTPDQKWQHSDNQTIGSEDANSVMDSEIVKTGDSDGTKVKKRKREKNKSLFEQYYFHDNMLK